MVQSGVFTDVLAAVDPGTVLRTEAAPQRRRRALGASEHVPTNQEILEAARRHYADNHHVVDTSTRSGQDYVLTGPGHVEVADLNAYDWRSREAAPIRPTCQTVADAPPMAPALTAVKGSPVVTTLVVGISESAQVIVGEEGGIGVAVDVTKKEPVKGVAYFAGKLGLDIDVAINLQLGLWASDVAGLAGDFVGIEVNLDLEVGVSLGVFMHTKDLSFYGFSVGVGVGVGGGATVVGGYTWVF
ncbi:hypothetical protein [Luteimicrobium subarcticum]|uniref:Uncharacterized protein n=1 Tax=Luteimicrobium subarcticum TaxID=620910 RepID=A0A2M8WS51_9MICO|nr:hypothetical protein [Luteimicrobium subarcticum]PJI93666.1 hypothetical protein CLV34_1140 [Luteimicrobium subarcticum]